MENLNLQQQHQLQPYIYFMCVPNTCCLYLTSNTVYLSISFLHVLLLSCPLVPQSTHNKTETRIKDEKRRRKNKNTRRTRACVVDRWKMIFARLKIRLIVLVYVCVCLYMMRTMIFSVCKSISTNANSNIRFYFLFFIISCCLWRWYICNLGFEEFWMLNNISSNYHSLNRIQF